jgi:hypothetical protein
MRNKLNRRVVLTVIIILSLAAAAYACSVPVYRYALERWDSDPYVIEVLANGPMEGDANEAAALLRSYSDSRESYANIWVRWVDLAAGEKEPINKVEPNELAAGDAEMRVYLPVATRRKVQLWSGEFTKANVKKVIDSPLRSKIGDGLIRGDSAVWIFLAGGDKTKDTKARNLLIEELKKMEKLLTSPEAVVDTNSDFKPPVDWSAEEYIAPVTFSVVDMLRGGGEGDDFLLEMLMVTEPDLKDEKYAAEPMAIPVFGRGRALYTLVGPGINERNIAEACAFLTGPCSCQVKYLNPGTDLLMNANWYQIFEGVDVKELDAPPLAGIMIPEEIVEEAVEADPVKAAIAEATEAVEAAPEVAAAEEVAAASEEVSTDTEMAQAGGGLMQYGLYIVIGALVFVIGASVMMKAGGKKN